MNPCTHSSIHKAFEVINDLQPLSPNATPRTTKQFKDTTDKYTRLMNFHLSAIRAVSGVDSNIDWDEPEPLLVKLYVLIVPKHLS